MGRIEIRKFGLADREPTESVVVKAFPGINPAGIVERELSLAPETCFVAVLDGVIVGMACAVQYDRWAYIGPMAVAPECQGTGIGRLLLERLVETLEVRRCLTMMLDATEAGEPLYRKFGFVEWARTADLGRKAGPGIECIPPVQDLELVLQIDLRVFGNARGPVFQRFLDHEGAALYSNSSAYLVAQAKMLGPFAGYNRDAAARVLDDALNAGVVASRVLAPGENREAEPLLVSRGFEVQREVKHMRRGRPAAMRRDLMYGLASFALG